MNFQQVGWAAIVCLVLGHSSVAWGRIKLVTLPVRERVEIQLDHDQATLVEEERLVPLSAGVNQVDFSWANTAIQPDSMQFRSLTEPDQIKVLAVSYPPQEHALVWDVYSPKPTSARIRISYILGGLSKSFSYKVLADRDEKFLTLRQFLQLHNTAPENFGFSGVWVGFGDYFQKPIGDGETKELLCAKFEKIPVVKTYVCDPSQHGYLDRGKNQLAVPMHYVLKNTTQAGLGRFALVPGKVRIFQEDRQGGSAFIGENWLPVTSLDGEASLYLGQAKDVVVKRTIQKNERHVVFGNLFHQEVILKYNIENFKDQSVTLDIQESLSAVRGEVMGQGVGTVDWRLDSDQAHSEWRETDSTKVDSDHVLFHVPLPARSAEGSSEKLTFEIHLWIQNEWF